MASTIVIVWRIFAFVGLDPKKGEAAEQAIEEAGW